MKYRKIYIKTRLLTILVTGFLALAGMSTNAVASDRGELLYENHCQDCHDKSVHTRDELRATSPELLRAWVMSWSIHNGLFWGEDEIADISAYLDQTFYHFNE